MCDLFFLLLILYFLNQKNKKYETNKNHAFSATLQVGPDYVDKLILPELHSAVANITSEYNARALYTDARAQLTQELRQYLQDKLGHKGIVIEDVLLRAIKLPEQLTKAIQDKLRTEQVRCFLRLGFGGCHAQCLCWIARFRTASFAEICSS
jgi:hypothetical protein